MVHFSGPPLKESSVRNLEICLCLASVAWSLLTYLNCSLFNNNPRNKLGKHPCVFLRSQGEGLDLFSMNSPLLILPPEAYGLDLGNHLDAPGQPPLGDLAGEQFCVDLCGGLTEISAPLTVC